MENPCPRVSVNHSGPVCTTWFGQTSVAAWTSLASKAYTYCMLPLHTSMLHVCGSDANPCYYIQKRNTNTPKKWEVARDNALAYCKKCERQCTKYSKAMFSKVSTLIVPL